MKILKNATSYLKHKILISILLGIVLLTSVFVYLQHYSFTYFKYSRIWSAGNNATLSLIAVGDLSFARGVDKIIKRQQDLNYPFKNVQDYLRSADFVFSNLETVVSSDCGGSHGPMFICSNPSYLSQLSTHGFNIVSVANNHVTDLGTQGIIDTLRMLQQHSIKFVGANVNLNSAAQAEFLSANGITVAVLAFVDPGLISAEKISTLHNPSVAPLDIKLMQQAVRAAKKHADFVIVSMHAGEEYKEFASQKQINFAHAAIDAGAVLVIGHHPHVIQPAEQYHGGYIFYSLGNFIFDQIRTEDLRFGMTLRIIFTKKGIVTIELNPTYEYNFAQPGLIFGEKAKLAIARLQFSNITQKPVFYWDRAAATMQETVHYLIHLDHKSGSESGSDPVPLIARVNRGQTPNGANNVNWGQTPNGTNNVNWGQTLSGANNVNWGQTPNGTNNVNWGQTPNGANNVNWGQTLSGAHNVNWGQTPNGTNNVNWGQTPNGTNNVKWGQTPKGANNVNWGQTQKGANDVNWGQTPNGANNVNWGQTLSGAHNVNWGQTPNGTNNVNWGQTPNGANNVNWGQTLSGANNVKWGQTPKGANDVNRGQPLTSELGKHESRESGSDPVPLIVRDKIKTWFSKKNWWVDDFILADVTNRGTPDLVFSLWKQGNYFKPPFWHKSNEQQIRNHLFIYKTPRSNGCETIAKAKSTAAFRDVKAHCEKMHLSSSLRSRIPAKADKVVDKELQPLWGSSNLDAPICKFAVTDINQDGENELVVLEGDYKDYPNCDGKYLAIWKWNGWGFTNLWRSEAGEYHNFMIRKMTIGNNAIIVE